VNRLEGLPRYLRVEEVADLLRTTPKAIYVQIERRQLPGVTRIGKRVLVSAEILLSWLSDQQDSASSLHRKAGQR
jgi:excisionase family DNA binding protein